MLGGVSKDKDAVCIKSLRFINARPKEYQAQTL